MARLFLSYKRGVQPDEPLALEIYERLSANHQVFIDRTLLVGQDWVNRIQQEVGAADFMILLLSEHSVQSQMVAEEVRMADSARKQAGKPRVLPVRVAFEGALPYDLGAILNRIQLRSGAHNWTPRRYWVSYKRRLAAAQARCPSALCLLAGAGTW